MGQSSSSLTILPKLPRSLTRLALQCNSPVYELLAFLGSEVISSWVSHSYTNRHECSSPSNSSRKRMPSSSHEQTSDPSDGDVSDADETDDDFPVITPYALIHYFRKRSVLASFHPKLSSRVGYTSKATDLGTDVEAIIGALSITMISEKNEKSFISVILPLFCFLNELFGQVDIPPFFIPATHSDVRPLSSPPFCSWTSQ
ncbi:hypothetical protein GEMRC1_006522 [Eukaryota sp. GEM-RC1]